MFTSHFDGLFFSCRTVGNRAGEEENVQAKISSEIHQGISVKSGINCSEVATG